ncbi:DUF4907 domain-containing protein [Flavobacterium fluviatile]|uniref:DUF4907 domain-containing protein n=1 Tax=Flavobacterium fluviatile TaxID=1862387 RepID=UPI001FCB648F|nr:DUF4907 domain-containing protein [Flavobacterium fluviatile]
MTMIINSTITKFFRKAFRKNLLFILLFLPFTTCSKKEILQAESIKTTSGWGYTISYKDKILIKQTIIPVISETKSFSSEDDALKVAGLVVKKLNQSISPSVTKNDLILLKIKM